MGERLQVFLIARVDTRKGDYVYKCIGAFHHQWCYAILPLRALHRFFNLLRERENAAAVRDELRCLCSWDAGKSESSEPWRNPAIPCPFAVSLLSIAWTTDLEHQTYLSNYTFGNGLIDAQKDCWHRASLSQNDVGICVIDLSDIAKPAYCFVRRPRSPVLTAYQYLRPDIPPTPPRTSFKSTVAYVSDGRENGRYLHALQCFWALVDLAGYPIIPASTLCAILADAAVDRTGPKQLEVPPAHDLPMPLDIVVSLYLGLTDKALLEALKGAFGVLHAHQAVGKAVLPPYDGRPRDLHRRTNVVITLLSEQRAFEYVLTSLWCTTGSIPAYDPYSDLERLGIWADLYGGATGVVSLDPFVDPTPSGLREWMSNPLMQRWNDLLHPARVLRTCLTLHQPFPDRLLDALWFTLQELGETSFLDLSFLRLSVPQVINILKRFTNVEALSLSHNPDITAIHLPFIVASTPTLRRLHVMHINDKSGLDIPSLLALHPPRLRQLEGILNPQFLSCSHTTKWTASFVFRLFSRASIDDSHYVSIPMFTPKQVVLALTDILSLAFQENRYWESTRLWTNSGPLMRRAGPNAYVYSADGFPFYMAARMFLHASLSCVHFGLDSLGASAR